MTTTTKNDFQFPAITAVFDPVLRTETSGPVRGDVLVSATIPGRFSSRRDAEVAARLTVWGTRFVRDITRNDGAGYYPACPKFLVDVNGRLFTFTLDNYGRLTGRGFQEFVV